MLRNKEFRQFSILFSILAVIEIAIGFAIGIEAGILIAISIVVFGMLFLGFTKSRYGSIAHLSNQIDLVLHNAEHLDIDESDEGELSILRSEITKMMLRIREQNDALKQEKVHLADSLADIAHQLRTPLTSVNIILSLLANNPNKEEQNAFVREAEGLLVQMDWLITSLLKLSRLDAGVVEFHNEQVDVNHLLVTAIAPLEISMEIHEVDVQIDAPEGLIIQGDLAWLSEAIRNILKNCMENVGNNGKIKVVCTSNPLFTEMTIHDNGTGFKKEDLPYLFDRFYQGRNAKNVGYGIGLSLSRTIITRQGGTITAKNHPRGGAIFTIRFPK